MSGLTLDRRSALQGALALGLAGAVGSARAAAVGGLIPAGDPRLQFEGRTLVTEAGAVRLGFPGIVLRAATDGARTALRCAATTGDCWVDVQVDGGPARAVRLGKGEQTLELASGPPRRRLIEMTRRTEGWMGLINVLGVTVSGGGLLAPPALPRRKLTFVGDSITCGAGDEWPDPKAADGSVHENARTSFGAILARRLHAQRHLISYGGRGVIRDWQGIRDIVNAPQFYDRILPDDPKTRWDPSLYVPDVVGICLGTNDFNQGVPDQYEFVNGYVELLSKIRRDAPRATIFVIDSPMTDDSEEKGPRRTVQLAFLDEVVARAQTPRVRRAHLRHYQGRAPIDAHPTGPEHELMATELEPLFRDALKAAA